ncbi:MAG: hypothetical protein L0H10_27900, partial [Comamonas sp.]|nr:hypothetical protein [Comamonas sp.]
ERSIHNADVAGSSPATTTRQETAVFAKALRFFLCSNACCSLRTKIPNLAAKAISSYTIAGCRSYSSVG